MDYTILHFGVFTAPSSCRSDRPDSGNLLVNRPDSRLSLEKSDLTPLKFLESNKQIGAIEPPVRDKAHEFFRTHFSVL